MKSVMADNTATVHKILSTSLQPAIAKALKGMDAATSSMAAASIELESCINAARGKSPVEVKRGGRKPNPNKGPKSASSDGSGDKDASFSDMEHDQLVVLVKGAVCSSLTEKMDPLFEQLTASVQSSLLSVAQQSLQITRQMAAADVSSLKQELSLVTTSVKTLAAQLSECMAEVRSMLLANSKDNRPSTQECTKGTPNRTSSSSTKSRRNKGKRARLPPPLPTSPGWTSSDSSAAPPTPPPEVKKHKKHKSYRMPTRDRPEPPLSSVDPNTAHTSNKQLQQIREPPTPQQLQVLTFLPPPPVQPWQGMVMAPAPPQMQGTPYPPRPPQFPFLNHFQ